MPTPHARPTRPLPLAPWAWPGRFELEAPTAAAVPWIAFLAWLAAFTVYAATLGPDATWDLRNYHLYNPFAVLHGRYDFDVGPAQLQGYFNPLADFPAYFLRWWLADQSRLLNAILAVPYAAGAQLVSLIALRFIPAAWRWRWPLAMGIAGFGMSGVATLSLVATSQSGILSDCCVLLGALLLLGSVGGADGRPGARPHVRFHALPGARMRLMGAGLAFGVGFGLKLTVAVYCCGAMAAVPLVWPGSLRARLGAACLLSLAMAAGAVAVSGWWWLRLWQEFGNPLFPFYNDVFKSPFVEAVSATDERFKPQTVVQALFYPYFWGLRSKHPVIELAMRDPRILFGLVALIATAAAMVRGAVIRGAGARRPGRDARPAVLLLLFCAVSYVAWEALFSILRYLAPVEMLCGVLLWLPVRAVATRGFPRAAVSGALLVAGVTLALTRYPDWERGPPGAGALDIDLPPIDPAAMVLILDGIPASYVAPFLPEGVRVVGVNNNLVWPNRPGLMPARAEALVRSHGGPFYGIESPDSPEPANTPLAFYGLVRDEARCVVVAPSFDPDTIRLCPLRRADPAE